METVQAIVFGNINLDILCYPVDDVPRRASIGFERGVVSPGGCASNVAIGLHALGLATALVARLGDDEGARIVETFMDRIGLSRQYIHRTERQASGMSVVLIDSGLEPRFVHMPGANACLSVDDLPLADLAGLGAKLLHIAGFFVLPGLLDGRLPVKLAQAQDLSLGTSLDVVDSPAMEQPEVLWPCLPYLDVFLCNRREAARLTGEDDPVLAARHLRARGARAVVVKLGREGCWLEAGDFSAQVPGVESTVVDTTGGGDAFAAGFVAARFNGASLHDACRAANAAGARIVSTFGPIEGWF